MLYKKKCILRNGCEFCIIYICLARIILFNIVQFKMIIHSHNISKIITWNINSIRARRNLLDAIIINEQPDVILLQEIKCIEAQFEPVDGYNAYIAGQLAYNGVAILVRKKINVTDVEIINVWQRNEARCIKVVIDNISIISIYVPCGWPKANTSDDIEHTYKLQFLRQLYDFMQQEMIIYPYCIIGGDFNVTITDKDVQYPVKNKNHILCRQDARKIMQQFLDLGLYDNITGKNKYSWLSYQERKGWVGDGAFRIDYILSNIDGTQSILNDPVSKDTSSLSKPSDHYPIIFNIK